MLCHASSVCSSRRDGGKTPRVMQAYNGCPVDISNMTDVFWHAVYLSILITYSYLKKIAVHRNY